MRVSYYPFLKGGGAGVGSHCDANIPAVSAVCGRQFNYKLRSYNTNRWNVKNAADDTYMQTEERLKNISFHELRLVSSTREPISDSLFGSTLQELLLYILAAELKMISKLFTGEHLHRKES